MDDVASMRNENANLRKIQNKLLQWEVKTAPLAALSNTQQNVIDKLSYLMSGERKETDNPSTDDKQDKEQRIPEGKSNAFEEMKRHGKVTTTHDFLLWFDKIDLEIHEQPDELYSEYLQELQFRTVECDKLLAQISVSLAKINDLKDEFHFVANKTSSLNVASEKLIQEQTHLNKISEEIRRRLMFFNQVEQLSQRFLSPTLSVTSDGFKDCLNKVDECLDYLKQKSTFKEAALFTMKYKQCLAKAILLMRNYVSNVILQATEQMRTPKDADEKYNPDTAFALYYGKFSLSAVKVKMVSSIIEERIDKSPEYKQLLIEIHQCYLSERAKVMSPAVEGAIRDLRGQNKGDHCTLVRSACAFLVHVCQDEHRLFYQFFSLPTEELNSYLAGLCTILYDNLRPYIIHINHLETLAEICSILRSEMLEEHVQQSPDSLESFGKEAFQLLQDVQERLVFRAHLYLQSDILNYNPSPGDLAYPEKLEMMESIAYSLQEPSLRRSDSRNSMTSTSSSALHDPEAHDMIGRNRFLNSPADLHGMWYPTVRRTLVCLSRLYRCVDRPIFQGLSQEALKYCIQSITQAAAKISITKSTIDGELFEIKHLLILREQIAPFRVDFTIKETSLDFSKVKTAAFGLLQKRKQLFSLGSNNALLEFLLEGTPQVKEHLLDSRKEVDRQLKLACEQFIKDAVNMLVPHILSFLKRAQSLLSDSESTDKTQSNNKINYSLRQSSWASPQQISCYIQESQRLIKSKLSGLQRSMQLYLSNRDTEFIIFRPIRNNILSAFVKVEQILTTNGYTQEDMIIASCPSAEQVSVLLSSASILTDSAGPAVRKTSTISNESMGSSKRGSEEKKLESTEAVPKVEGEEVI